MGITVPADSKYGITVGAVDGNGNVAPFSSSGPSFDGRIKFVFITIILFILFYLLIYFINLFKIISRK